MKKKRAPKKVSPKQQWETKFITKLRTIHTRNVESKVKKLLRKIDRALRSMIVRSRKNKVACTITIEDLRILTLAAYGTKCKYSDRILTMDNIVYDHIIPISKGGASSKDNIQVISKFANNIKSNLSDNQFNVLLAWLEKLPENLQQYVSIKLAGGRYASIKDDIVLPAPEKQLLLETTGDLLH